ncbi:MAG: FlgD immunoglobulin-like domain containing protein [Candidatus Zixiibacteriota bacterium]
MHPGLGGVFKSTDGGASWDTTGLRGLDVVDLKLHPTNPDILYAACYVSDGATPGIFKTTDGGHTWFWSSNGIHLVPWETGAVSIAIHPKGPDTLLAGTGGPMGGGLYKSTDNGENWTELIGFGVNLITFDVESPTTIYAMIGGSGLNKSVDSGITWFPILSGSTGQMIRSFTIDPVSSKVLYAGTADRGIFKSIDAGTTWAAINEGFPANLHYLRVQSIVIDPTNPDIIYAGTGREGIFKSEDAGLSWAKIDPEIPNRHVNTLVLAQDRDKTLYAGTENGVWRLLMTTDVDFDHDNNIEGPKNYALYQNYPNPFNPSTDIGYEVPDLGSPIRTTLKIYNILGQEVWTLVDEVREPGYYTVTWDGRDERGQAAPTGIYFYELLAPNFTSVRKMLLLR